MSPEEQQAEHLIEYFGKKEAISHCEWVLSSVFALHKLHLRDYWKKVLSCIKEIEK